jgi:DNA mismatch repair protein MutL
MSSRIKILPENLTNKISAGEVVERPASVVKELVENCLDAGATEIVVEIEAGGKRLIKVGDNGCGMSREDALLALERHATSKIATDDDLGSISTLGFRGEALPSIASVSRWVMATREKGSIEGTEIYGEGGRIRDVKARGMAEGTVVEIRNLFFNTPARLKFLKSTETEAGHVGDQMTRLALSRPEVRFTYMNDGRTVFRALNGTLGDRISALLGRNIAGDLYPFECSGEELALSGSTGKPDCTRSSSSHLYVFVNGRFVRDRLIQHAVMQAYRQLLERGRYPVAVLFLSVPVEEVDVNVHPTKHEVRFRSQSRVHDFIVSALEKHLRSTPWIGKSLLKAVPLTVEPYSCEDSPGVGVKEAPVAYVRPREERPEQHPLPVPVPETVSQPADSAEPRENGGFFSSLRVIGQYRGAYLLCQGDDDLLIIDQHAAHERVAFERLRTDFSAGEVESQGVLFPEVVELTHGEASIVDTHQSFLRKLGFHLEHFGGTARVLNAVPRILSSGPYLQALRDIIEELAAFGNSRAVDDVQDDLLVRIACHSVVRGQRNLPGEEVSALLAALDSVACASNCPHGRPVYRTLSRSDVEKMFKRL